MKNSYFLVIPKQDLNAQHAKAFEPKFVEQWIAELPIGNTLLAARLFYEYIADANAAKIPAQTRLEALELLKPSFYTIKSFLSRKLIKIDFPKEENDRKSFKMLMSLEKQMALGYWMVLSEFAESDKNWFQRKNPLPSIHYCLQRLTSIAISHYMMGVAIPDWLWLDFHSLYELTLEAKKEDALLALTDINYLNKQANPEDNYLRLILLSLANPSGLTPQEIKLTYDFITTIQPLIRLKREPVKGQDTQCVIVSDEDKPPRFMLASELSETNGGKLFIDFTELYDAFAKGKLPVSQEVGRFSSMRTGEEAQGKPSADLLSYLKKRWTGIPLESDPLFTDRLDRYIAIGMTSTFNLQKGIAAANQTEEPEILVQTASKRLLSGVFTKPGEFSIGSLVSFRRIDCPEHKRFIGIVNFLTAEKDDNKITFGIHLLGHQSIPVSFKGLNASSNTSAKPALFYKSDGQNGILSYLITDTFKLKEGDVIMLSINQENFPIILNNKKNVGLGYWRFECRKVVEKNQYGHPVKPEEHAELSG